MRSSRARLLTAHSQKHELLAVMLILYFAIGDLMEANVSIGQSARQASMQEEGYRRGGIFPGERRASHLGSSRLLKFNHISARYAVLFGSRQSLCHFVFESVYWVDGDSNPVRRPCHQVAK
jgi:hypothetical protein